MDAGHPGKTEAKKTLRPVPGSSKPSLILLYAGKDDAGALDAYLHAYNPAFSEYIWAVDIRRKGGDLGQDMLGEWPWRARSHWWEVAPTARWFPKPGGPVLMLRQMYLTSLAYKGLGQLTVPQVGSSFLEHLQQEPERRGAHRSGSRGPTFNGRGHSTAPSSSSTSAAWARWL